MVDIDLNEFPTARRALAPGIVRIVDCLAALGAANSPCGVCTLPGLSVSVIYNRKIIAFGVAFSRSRYRSSFDDKRLRGRVESDPTSGH